MDPYERLFELQRQFDDQNRRYGILELVCLFELLVIAVLATLAFGGA